MKKQGLFVALKFSEKLTPELNAGREEPVDRNASTYAGVAIATTF